MTENSQAMAATMYRRGGRRHRRLSVLHRHGRELRRQLEPALDDFARELNSFRGTVDKAAGVASEGWKLLNEAIGETRHRVATRYPTRIRRVRSEEATWKVNLGTTNLLLGIMAVVSVLEALVLIGIGVAGFMVVPAGDGARQRLEARQVAPAMARVNAILDDVKGVTREGEGRDRARRSRDSARRSIGSTTRPIACARTCGRRPAGSSASSAARAWRSRRCCSRAA